VEAGGRGRDVRPAQAFDGLLHDLNNGRLADVLAIGLIEQID
jgi:hypothetical protein